MLLVMLRTEDGAPAVNKGMNIIFGLGIRLTDNAGQLTFTMKLFVIDNTAPVSRKYLTKISASLGSFRLTDKSGPLKLTNVPE